MGLHPLEILILICCIYHYKIAVVPYLVHDQVIHHTAIFIAHGAVAGLAIGHDRIVIGQDHVQVLLCITASADDLPHV